MVKLRNGTYAMTDGTNHQIQIYTINKENTQNTSSNPISKYSVNMLNTFGSKGTGNGELSFPTDIIETSDNKLFVLDCFESRIQIFDTSGNYISQFGSEGSENGQFGRLYYFTQLTNTNIAISDSKNSCVQIVDTSGNFISKFGSVGIKEGEFGMIYGISQLVDGNIAVCDPDNNRIQIFDTSGNYINLIDKTDLEEKEYYNEAFKPYNLIQLEDENIAVLDKANCKIQIFDVDGNHIGKISVSNNLVLMSITQLMDGILAITTLDKNKNEKCTINFYSKIDKKEQENEPLDIPAILKLINYNPYMSQERINIYYWQLCNEKKFNYIVEKEQKIVNTQYINYKKIKHQSPPDIEKIQNIFKINIFDTLFENRKILLTKNSKPFFGFINVVNKVKDDGIDAGGLTKTVFYELSKYLTSSNSPFFVKDEDTKLYQLKLYYGDNKDLHNQKIYFLGQLFGFVIKLKLTIDVNLNPILLYQLTHTLSSNKINKELVSKIINELNPNLLNVSPYVCYNDLLAQSKTICVYDEYGDEINMINVETETNKRIGQSIKQQMNSNKYFIKGFRNQIDIEKSQIDRLPLKKLDELISGISKIDFKIFNSNVNFINFTSQQVNVVKQLIIEHIKINDIKTYLETLLLVMTGSNKIPANGYPIENKLRFELNKYIEPKPIDIHSCFNQFIINPKLVNEYISSTNKEETELYTTFDIETLKGFTQDFSSA